MKFLFVLFFLVLAFVAGAAAQERYVKPVDEGKKDASFYKFRTKLIEAAKKRNVKYILSILDEHIMNSFGGGGGIEEFKEHWKINSSESEFWKEFLTVLQNGGAFYKEPEYKNTFCAPYVCVEFPTDLRDYGNTAIFGSNVNLHSEPSLTAPVVASLSYNIVKLDFENSVEDKNGYYSWYKVETLGGKKGFVKAEYVRSPGDYTASFEKIGRKWKMTAFIAGD